MHGYRFQLAACVQADLQGGLQLPVQRLGRSAAGCEILIFSNYPRHQSPGIVRGFLLRNETVAAGRLTEI
jgi:hypothetical protein